MVFRKVHLAPWVIVCWNMSRFYFYWFFYRKIEGVRVLSAYRDLVQSIGSIVNGKVHLPMKCFCDQSPGAMTKIDLCIVTIEYTVMFVGIADTLSVIYGTFS